MKVLYVGLHYLIEDEEYLLHICKGVVSAAHFKFQNNLISAFKEQNVEIEVVSALPVGNYPIRCKKLFFKSRKAGKERYEIGCINLPVIKHIQRKIKLKHFLKRWIKKNKSENPLIFVYDAYLPFVKAAIECKDKFPYCKIVSCLPDLPGQLGLESGIYTKSKELYLKRRAEKFYNIIDGFDGYVLLTKHMVSAIRAESKPYIIIEGITGIDEQSDDVAITDSDKKAILYAGQLNTNNGIDTLLKAFSELKNDNCQLWICGNGAMANQINEYAERDVRIKYFGYVPIKEMSKIEREAAIFINPRQDIYEYTKYSFPSKNLEYLKTGKPLIAYKLSGIPDEYDEFIFYPKDNTVSALTEEIENVLQLDSKVKENISIEQKRFVREYKGINFQGKKLVDFIKDRVLCE